MATFGTFASGQILTAAELNGAGAWQDYTPTWTQSATITKTVNWARYTQLNKWVQVSIQMTASSAGTANNIIKVGLPVNASSKNFLMGRSILVDISLSSGSSYGISAIYDTTSTVKFLDDSEGDYTNGYVGQTASSLDVTIASGDLIMLNLAYEAA